MVEFPWLPRERRRRTAALPHCPSPSGHPAGFNATSSRKAGRMPALPGSRPVLAEYLCISDNLGLLHHLVVHVSVELPIDAWRRLDVAAEHEAWIFDDVPEVAVRRIHSRLVLELLSGRR